MGEERKRKRKWKRKRKRKIRGKRVGRERERKRKQEQEQEQRRKRKEKRQGQGQGNDMAYQQKIKKIKWNHLIQPLRMKKIFCPSIPGSAEIDINENNSNVNEDQRERLHKKMNS